MAAGSMLQAEGQQRQQRKAQEADLMANAANIEYSPWTGMQAQMKGPQAIGGTGDIIGAGIQGGMMGAMFNAQNPTKTDPTGTKPSIYSPKTVDEEQLLKSQYQGTTRQGPAMNARGPGKFSSWFGVPT